MESLFGYDVQPITYKVPLTAQKRADIIADKLAAKIASKKIPEFKISDYNISSFPRPEVKSVFIGQNIYARTTYMVSMPEYVYCNSETGEILDRNPRTMTEDFKENEKNLLDNSTGGKLSRKAIQNLRNAINWLCFSAKKKRVYMKETDKNFFFRVNFVTLTLPDTKEPITSQDLQKKLLNPWLTYMRQEHGLKHYVWRLEFQANGKLHVHICTDTFLHHQKIRDVWNRLLDKNGYMDLFFKKNKHRDPNSTDVHATRKIKNMGAYLAKYMGKLGSEYQLPEKRLSDNINKAVLAGIGEKGLTELRLKLKKVKNSKVRPLGVMYPKRWYKQRLNFWNSSFNPRPISGRIWGCSSDLSKANKLMVHVPANECSEHLACLMRKDIMYKDIFAVPSKNSNKAAVYSAPGLTDLAPKKIGEVFFLTAKDWLTKIDGVIKEAFDRTRWMLANGSDRAPVLEMG